MSASNDTTTHEIEPDDHSPPLPTASDTRRQIIANALVIFPNIVRDHIAKFPSIPVRATDIFDVCVANVTEQNGSEHASKYIAKLHHGHKEFPAARLLLLSGGAMPTMKLALHDLLERSADGLKLSLDDLLPVREGCIGATELHVETASMGLQFAKEVRQTAMEYDMGNERTLLNASDV